MSWLNLLLSIFLLISIPELHSRLVSTDHDKLPDYTVLDYTQRYQYYCDEVLNQCSGHGRCLLEKCICNPGWTGARCDEVYPVPVLPCAPLQCTNSSEWNPEENKYQLRVHCNEANDSCHYHPEYGVLHIPYERWRIAQMVELQIWVTTEQEEDRNDEHQRNFQSYQSLLTHLPSRNLGNVLEIASGPYTQLKTILQSLPSDFTLKSVTLLEPNLMEYKTRAPGCSYKDGTLLGHRVNFLVGRGEDFLFSEVYDMVIMINGIEHCQDGISVLHNLYHAIKPGGYLIWHERSFDEYEGLPYSYSDEYVDFIFHPLRLKTSFFEWFLLDHFESIYYNVSRFDSPFTSKNLTEKTIYFIGRKPLVDRGWQHLQERRRIFLERHHRQQGEL